MRTHVGFTLLELLLVISIMGILLTLGVPMLRPPSSYLFATDLKAMIQQARFESIKRNVPVAVVWRRTDQAFTTQSHSTNFASNQACNATGTTIIRTKNLADYRNLSVTNALTQNGVVWLPTGLARLCDGSWIANSTTLTDDRATYKINISTAGRVMIEKRP